MKLLLDGAREMLYTRMRETMGDSDNNEKQPKFRSGPIVVWVSVGIAVFWAALLLFFGYGANLGT